MGPDRIWKTGDRCTIRYNGVSIAALIVLASSNGRSLALGFDGMLGGYRAVMPVLEKEGTFYDLFNNAPVEIT